MQIPGGWHSRNFTNFNYPIKSKYTQTGMTTLSQLSELYSIGQDQKSQTRQKILEIFSMLYRELNLNPSIPRKKRRAP